MKKLAIYIHGKGGSAAESEHYASLLKEYDVIGLDYKAKPDNYGKRRALVSYR